MVVKKLGENVVKTLKRKGFDVAIAEDVAQDMVLEALRNPATKEFYETKIVHILLRGGLPRYLRIRAIRRAMKFRNRWDKQQICGEIHEKSQSSDPVQIAEVFDFYESLDDSLQRTLTAVSVNTQKDAAETLGVSTRTVRNRMQKLRELAIKFGFSRN